jgi:hypothetical protein
MNNKIVIPKANIEISINNKELNDFYLIVEELVFIYSLSGEFKFYKSTHSYPDDTYGTTCRYYFQKNKNQEFVVSLEYDENLFLECVIVYIKHYPDDTYNFIDLFKNVEGILISSDNKVSMDLESTNDEAHLKLIEAIKKALLS